jgi:uncharacterized protein with GYD domain
MSTYIILSRLAPDAVTSGDDFRKRAAAVAGRIKEQCPSVHWKDSFATMGEFDVVDIVEADNPIDVERAATIIRSVGHATTQTLPATPWKQFIQAI